MLKFVVCEDNINFLANNCQIINKIMMRNNIDYKIFEYADYNQKLKTTIDLDGPKIYILDLELPSKSGLDLVREIRENDFYSQIIISSAHDELTDRAFKAKLMILDFISKYDNHEKRLAETIEYALNTLGKRSIIKIGSKNNSIIIDVDDILYITKENNNRKCTIRTKNNTFIANCNLINIKKQLKGKFINTHQSCLVNPKYISTINYSDLIITFKNGDIIKNMISRNYKKGLQNLWK